MGKVWVRNGQAPASREKAGGRPHTQQRSSSAHVWTRDTQQHPKNVNQPTYDKPDTASWEERAASLANNPEAKRRRLLAKGRLPLEPDGTPKGAVKPEESQKELGAAPQGAAELGSSHSDNLQKKLREEAAALARRIAEEEAKVTAAKNAAKRKEEIQAATEKAKWETQQLRKTRLDQGFAEAFRETRELAAKQQTPKVLAADEFEVQRVLSAQSDLGVLQLRPGADKAAVKKKYRAMTLALHPDKCKVASATDAFQRLVLAYQGALKYAR